MPSSIELANGNLRLIAAIRRSRQLLGRKALIAAAASAIPLPGLDWAADAALLSRLVPQISAEFGLSATQLDSLAPHKREGVQKAAAAVGALLIGKLVTRELLMTLASRAGLRLTAKQFTKYVPLAGQIVSAAIGYAALRSLGELHIKDCVRVAQAAQLVLPMSASDVVETSVDAIQNSSTYASAASAPRSLLKTAWQRLWPSAG